MPVDNEWYNSLGNAWWDPEGIVGPLHEINPTRVGYFCDILGDLGGMRILELGCGGGLMTEAYARRGAFVVAIDRSLPSLRVARRHGAEGGLVIPYAAAVAERLPFTDATFDAVVTADTLEHVDDLDSVVAQAVRVLKPGGRFVYDTINRTWKSRIILIWLAQDVFRIAPPNTHDYHRFVKPDELHNIMSRHGLTNRETRGLPMRENVLAAALTYARNKRFGGFTVGDDTSMSYAGYAVKDESAPAK